VKTKILFGLEAAGGGALKHLMLLVEHLNKEKYEITVCISNKRGNIDNEISFLSQQGARIMILPMERAISPIDDTIALFKISRELFGRQYNIVHAHSSKAGVLFRIAAFFCRVHKVFYTPHCFYFQGKDGVKRMFFALIEEILSFITTGLIVSESELRVALASRLRISKKFNNINNAIDFGISTHDDEVHALRDKLNIESFRFVVAAIGRIVPQKDLQTYIYAAEQVILKHPDAVFLIVGEGDQYNVLQTLVNNLGIDHNFRFTGHLTHIDYLYPLIDLVVNTSLWEGLPYTFLEAYKYRRPIIATDIGNEKYIINEETGFICKTGDYLSIAERIMELIDNRALIAEMGERGKKHFIDNYSLELFIKEHEKLYDM
jgi:glycosyltransferase involved in cell wall biosynthesis